MKIIRHYLRKVIPGRKRLIKLAKWGGVGIISLLIAFMILWFAFPFPQEKLWWSSEATVICDREGNILRVFINPDPVRRDNFCFPVSLKEMSPALISATLAVEDQRFRKHLGVDPLAVLRALGQNAAQQRLVSGASTITMQVIRLIWPRPRTLLAKLVESFRALQLETILSKDEILECYLNRAPYGGNLYGVEAASLRYFGKASRSLTLAESALLAGLPASPSRFRPDKYPDRARLRRDYVLTRMHQEGFISDGQLEAALAEPWSLVNPAKAGWPFDAPHFCQLVKDRYQGITSGRLITTLDRTMQQMAENVLAYLVNVLKPEGVTNGAVVIIENKTGAVRVMVGSRDFFDEVHSGQVNGALSSRSPGSALKPFTYALAFDKGVCLPSEVLPDLPTNYRDYDPENYEHRCLGIVSAREALIRSLNLPALNLLSRIGICELHQFLQKAGLTTLTKPSDYYGLGLTLGSSEVTLLELTNAYAALARLGTYQPYYLIESEAVTDETRQVISPAAAYLVADILSDPARTIPVFGSALHRPGGTVIATSNGVLPRIAWKTGTSYGHRDAWTIGYTPDYTVGVWLGNFSGRPARGLVGISASAPALFEIFRQIYNGKPSGWYQLPPEIKTIPVCAVSGLPVGPDCQTNRLELALKHPFNKTCSVHQAIMVDDATGKQLCPVCAPGRKYHYQTVEIWPPEINKWWLTHGRQTVMTPPHLPDCPRIKENNGLRITSPPAGQNYTLLNNQTWTPQKIRLDVATSAGTTQVYWFIDDQFYQQASPEESVFWLLQRGKHTISCIDSEGRSSSVFISVDQ